MGLLFCLFTTRDLGKSYVIVLGGLILEVTCLYTFRYANICT